MTKKLWECCCCGLVVIADPSNSVDQYECPACKYMECEEHSHFYEMSSVEAKKLICGLEVSDG